MRHPIQSPATAAPKHPAPGLIRGRVSSRCTLLVSTSLLFWASAALALPPERDEADLWVPSIGFQTGLTFERAAATVMSSAVTGSAASTMPQLLQPPAEGQSLMVTPFAGISVELMTPRLTKDWGMPRFFIHGDVGYAFGSTFDVAKEGTPGTLSVPPTSNTILSERIIAGQGAATSADVQPLQVNAGIGVAFSFDVFDTRIRLKPSLEYLREEIKITGVLSRAIQQQGVNTLDQFRKVNYIQRKDRVYHEIGPGLQVEADVGRWGPVVFAPYIGAQAFYTLTNRRSSLSESQIPPCQPQLNCVPPPAPESATWTFKKDRWTYRANAGLRLRFAPK